MTITAPVPGFDTLSYARRLKTVGVDEAQAEAHAEAVRDAITQGVATKADLDNLEARIDKRFADLETRIEKRFAALEVRLVRLVFAVAAGQAALIVALLKLLP